MPMALIKSPVRTIAASQAGVTLLLAVTALLVSGRVMAWSMLLGGVLSLVPSAWFARLVFRQGGGARATVATVRDALVGELMKLAMVGAGFALVFVLVDPLQVPGLFAAFVLVHIAGLVASIRHAQLTG